MSDMTALRGLWPFTALEEGTLVRLCAEAKFETLDDAAVVLRQGDPASVVIFVVDGFVRLLRIAASGDETVIKVAGRGDCVGAPAFGPNDIHSVSAEAVGRVTLLKIPTNRFARILREAPDLAEAALSLTKLAIDALIAEIELLKAYGADQRLAKFILSLCPAGAESCGVTLPFDKRLIASLLGVTQETLSRSFARMREVGVRTDARVVFIEDIERLQAYCEDSRRFTRPSALHETP